MYLHKMGFKFNSRMKTYSTRKKKMRELVYDGLSEDSAEKEEEESDDDSDERWCAPSSRVKKDSKLIGAFVNNALFYT